MISVRSLLAIALAILTAGLMMLVTACGSGVRSSSSTETRPGPAVKLAFTTQPIGGIAGSAFGTQPVVAAEDAGGNIVTDYKDLIVLTITAGTGDSKAQLLGGTKKNLTNGKVEFEYLSIDKAGVGYTLTASSVNLIPATSAPLTILPGAPAKLAFAVQPVVGKAGTPLTPNPEVTVQDSKGNTVTDFKGSISVWATSYFPDFTGSSQYEPKISTYPVALSGTTTVQAVNGVARFPDISIKHTGPRFTLTVTSDSLGSATSNYFSILPGAPAKLAFTVQPAGSKAGLPFETQPKVAIEDIYENVVTSSRDSITISISPGSGTYGAILSGTNRLIAEDAFGGLAEFRDLSIDLPGSGYMLTATANGLPPVNSQALDVLAP
jgi:hypothetical protein